MPGLRSERITEARARRFQAGPARLVGAALALAGAQLASERARAEPVTLSGITFSDELGGVVIHAGRGSGSREDPFVLVEDITEDGPAVLVVRGLRQQARAAEGAFQRTGFSLTKIVTNRTTRGWHAFEMELREDLAKPSTYGDGLSFAQFHLAQRSFRADRYAHVSMMDEPIDAVVFSDGHVAPGETVTVSVIVTDFTPRDAFYLLQRRDSPTARLSGRPG